MKKRDFESYHKRFRDVEVLKKFSETHVFRGKIRHPLSPYYAECGPRWTNVYQSYCVFALLFSRKKQDTASTEISTSF